MLSDGFIGGSIETEIINVYDYDSQGLIQTLKIYKQGDYVGMMRFQYDAQRRVIEKEAEASDGDASIEKIKYWDDDIGLHRKNELWKNGEIYSITESLQDKNTQKLLTEKIEMFQNGKVASSEKKTYYYDTKGNQIAIVTSDGKITESTYKVFDKELGTFVEDAEYDAEQKKIIETARSEASKYRQAMLENETEEEDDLDEDDLDEDDSDEDDSDEDIKKEPAITHDMVWEIVVQDAGLTNTESRLYRKKCNLSEDNTVWTAVFEHDRKRPPEEEGNGWYIDTYTYKVDATTGNILDVKIDSILVH